MTNHDNSDNRSQNNLDLADVMRLRSAAHPEIRRHAVHIVMLASNIEAVDAAPQQVLAVRSVDEQQSLLTAAGSLSALLKNGGLF